MFFSVDNGKKAEKRNNIMLALGETETGKLYRVTDIDADDAMKKRLTELGVIRGTRLKREKCAPSGDPVSYIVRGAEIALRKECADMITVSEIT